MASGLASRALVFAFVSSALLANGVGAQRRAGAGPRGGAAVTVAPAGHYIQLDRCNACAGPGWQRETVAAFAARGLQAFTGSAKYDSSYRNIEFLERLTKIGDKTTPVYVGPFESESAARRVVARIPTILRRQIAEDNRGSTSGQTGMFDVRVERVRSSAATGGIGGLAPGAFTIRPGEGVGGVRLGDTRRQVRSVLGAPRYSQNTSDSWASGEEGISVYYRDGRVLQIEVSSSKFKTSGGVSAATAGRQFARLFPGSRKRCCSIIGASGFSEWACWDAVSRGLALRKGGHSGGGSLDALIVHAPGEPVSEEFSGADKCEPCR